MPNSSITVSKDALSQFKGTRYFPSLDGIRALCVTLVMFNHVHVRTPRMIKSPLGVDGFFVLSGFLITTLMLREKEKFGRISLKGFYIRRFFRIIPVYLFTILLYAVAIWRVHDPTRTAQFKVSLPWLLTFMEEYRPVAEAGNVMGHAWSLGIEEKFYLFWPLLVVLLLPFRGRKAWGLVAIAIVVALFPYPFDFSYAGLLIGALLAIVLSVADRWPWVVRVPAVPDAVLLLVLLGGYAFFDKNSHGNPLLFSLAFALLVASLVLRGGIVRRFLEHPALVFVGKRSYSFYLIHVLAIDAVETALGRHMTLNWEIVIGAAFVFSLAGASLMHIAIELPCITLGRRFSSRFAHHEPVSAPAT